ncbi:transmembrane protein fend-like [Culex pipiens pallens]|uniref:transmembrane protein fend-like n=1 Tax=Culex pipiens pallens TaxID=42434 RepID=UPI0022AA2CE6|nr:transmembrane protein fend-like [Culex pipiens pallens]
MAPNESGRQLQLAVLAAAVVCCCLQLTGAVGAETTVPSEVVRNGEDGRRNSSGTVTSSATAVPAESGADRVQLKQCRENCLKKHSTKESLCAQRRDCSLCQSKCSSSSSPHPAGTLTLVLLQMIRNDSLVTADVAWVSIVTNPTAKSPPSQQQQQHQCLVTWEVSGGGLMGNLLTESSSVQLSLWPETNYRVQVTCRNKNTDSLIRSAPIILNTSGATIVTTTTTPSSSSEPSTPQLEPGPASRNPALTTMWPITRQSQQDIILLGVFVAALTFLLILLTVVIFVKRKRLTGAGVEADKEVLVEGDSSGDEGTMVEILHV